LYHQLKDKVKIPIIIINNFMNKSEIEEKAVPAIKKIIKIKWRNKLWNLLII
jgi:hypothetical protein